MSHRGVDVDGGTGMHTVKFPPGAMAGGFCEELARWGTVGGVFVDFKPGKMTRMHKAEVMAGLKFRAGWCFVCCRL